MLHFGHKSTTVLTDSRIFLVLKVVPYAVRDKWINKTTYFANSKLKMHT